MLEYATIRNSSKAPHQNCIAFDKLDGSNCRFKYTQKRCFDCFGTRTQLIGKDTPFWSEIIEVFESKYQEKLEKFFRDNKDYRDFREIIVFGEFLGPNSFAGQHEDEEHDIVFFDVLCGHKNRKLVLPQGFVKDFDFVPIPEVVYRGNLNKEFIEEIRENTDLTEGVICKGTERRGDYFGGIWTCKIKTKAYFEKLKNRFGEKAEEYWE